MSDERDNDVREAINHPRGEPKLRGQRLFDGLDGLMRRFDRAIDTLLPARHNPFHRTGAVALVAFLVSAISGILLLIWYRPTVHQAYESMMAMEGVWIGSFLRSLHRYSSDVCIFFALIHALRLFFAGRFTGARWVAWVTGVGLIAVLWFLGWTGYMLVWDEPAQLIAQGSAMFLDGLPIFAEPISRSFLANELVPPLIFFAVFFIHMLLPLAMAAGVWLHVSRLQRPKVLTSRWMALWTVGALVLMAALLPAAAGDPADLQLTPAEMTIDAWYLAPLWLTDRLSAGMLWALVAIVGGLIIAAPWLLRKSPGKTASINSRACNGCTLCAQDCPYDAIVMVPRTDDRRYKLEAKLDPNLCVGCGICAGSCNPGGIGLDWLPVQAMRRRFDDWIEEFTEGAGNDDGPVLAFVCSGSAGRRLDIDEETGRCDELPGFRVVSVPCSGWVQPLTVERALRKGAAGVLVVGCSEGEPQFREGHEWTKRRMSATREPKLRREKIDADRVGYLTVDRSRPDEFITEAKRFYARVRGEDVDAVDDGTRPTGRVVAGAVVVAAVTAAVVTAGSWMPYPGPPKQGSKLAMAMNHYGQLEEQCEPIPEEERADQPMHMQREEECERRRADVIVEITVDDEVIYEKAHRPRGLAGGGPATMLDKVSVEPGERQVRVRVADGADGEFTYEFEQTLRFEDGKRQVLLFDTGYEFRHFAPE